MTKWYMHKTESIQEKETLKIRDFEIQTDHLILTRRPDLVIIKYRVKLKENEKKDKSLDLAWE